MSGKGAYLIGASLLIGSLSSHPQDANMRARQIVSRMTLDEKNDQLHGIGDAAGVVLNIRSGG